MMNYSCILSNPTFSCFMSSSDFCASMHTILFGMFADVVFSYCVANDARGWPSEALELGVEDGRVNHSWSMGEVSHGYGGLVGAGIVVVVGKHLGQGHVACLGMLEHCQSAR